MSAEQAEEQTAVEEANYQRQLRASSDVSGSGSNLVGPSGSSVEGAVADSTVHVSTVVVASAPVVDHKSQWQ